VVGLVAGGGGGGLGNCPQPVRKESRERERETPDAGWRIYAQYQLTLVSH
jgi:hypothetical protein